MEAPDNESSPRGPPRPLPQSGSGKSSHRRAAAIANVKEIQTSLESLQRLLVGKAVYLDEDPFTDASGNAEIARTMRIQDRRIEALERDLDAAVTAAGHARAEMTQGEIQLKVAERRTRDVSEDLEKTSLVFNLHAEELSAKSEEILKKTEVVKVLKSKIDKFNRRPQGK